jgi:colanic acid biosynthesis glycosyl transferase WcaI
VSETKETEGPSAVFLNRFYWPDVAATGQMLTDLAEDLAGLGWRVTVITSSGDYRGQQGALPSEEWRNGVRILRSGRARFGRHSVAGRLLDYLSYLTGTFLRLLRVERQDYFVAMSDPPFIALLALFATRIRGGRAVYWVQDLFPEIAFELGVLRPGSMAGKVARSVARWMHRRMDMVVVLGPRMAQSLVAAGAPRERTVVVHNWADATSIVPIAPDHNRFVTEHGLQGKFVILYSGNAGKSHPFEAVMEAARRLGNERDIEFVFVGGGARWPELKRIAEQGSLRGVRFVDYVKREELAFSLSAASVSLVTEDPRVVGLLVPSKTYGILASGRPLLFVGAPDSDVAELVRTTDCGRVVSPGDAAGLVREILALRNDAAERERLGSNARRAAENVYDRRHATARWAALVTGTNRIHRERA